MQEKRIVKRRIATSSAFQSVNNDPLMVVVSLLNSRLWEISGSYFSWKRSYSTIDVVII
jgi:hypothetical protein